MTDTLPTLTVFDWVPEIVRGLVRDLRVRWAFEELGQPYAVEKVQARGPKPEGYVARQPFEQVPALTDGDLQLFDNLLQNSLRYTDQVLADLSCDRARLSAATKSAYASSITRTWPCRSSSALSDGSRRGI